MGHKKAALLNRLDLDMPMKLYFRYEIILEFVLCRYIPSCKGTTVHILLHVFVNYPTTVLNTCISFVTFCAKYIVIKTFS